MPTASVVIRAKDEAANIGETLSRLRAQTIPPEEVQLIVVDSGSRDDTVRIAREGGARVLEIAPEAFTFGGSLNHGCTLAQAPVTVALSAHAFPTDEGWLARMVAALDDERVACACGDEYSYDGPPLRGRVEQDITMARRWPQWGYSNAAGAFRTALWRERAFRPDMPGTEDKEWAWWWLRRGYVSVVDAALLVDHRHGKDPVRDQYVRARREWVGFAMFLDPFDYRLGDLVRDWWCQIGGYRSATRARLSHRRGARLLGRYAGARRSALLAQLARPVQVPAPTQGAAPAVPERPLRVAIMVDRFPVCPEGFVTTEVTELQRLGHQVCVEAVAREIARGDPPVVPTAYVSDERPAGKLADLAWLVAGHPAACLRDLAQRRRWQREEEEIPGLRALAGRARRIHRRSIGHLHVHCVKRSALEAMRIGSILGVPYSVTAHAHEIFTEPAHLTEKLQRAAFVTSRCDDDVGRLRELLGPSAGVRVDKLVMGVDGERLARAAPLPAGRRVAAVGRIVEEKGLHDLPGGLEQACSRREAERLAGLIRTAALEARTRGIPPGSSL